jgi:hypothetical protein
MLAGKMEVGEVEITVLPTKSPNNCAIFSRNPIKSVRVAGGQ